MARLKSDRQALRRAAAAAVAEVEALAAALGASEDAAVEAVAEAAGEAEAEAAPAAAPADAGEAEAEAAAGSRQVRRRANSGNAMARHEAMIAAQAAALERYANQRQANEESQLTVSAAYSGLHAAEGQDAAGGGSQDLAGFDLPPERPNKAKKAKKTKEPKEAQGAQGAQEPPVIPVIAPLRHKAIVTFDGDAVYDLRNKGCTAKPAASRPNLQGGVSRCRVFDELPTNNNCLIYSIMNTVFMAEVGVRRFGTLVLDIDELQRVRLARVLTKHVQGRPHDYSRAITLYASNPHEYTIQQFRVDILHKYVERRFVRAFGDDTTRPVEGDVERRRLEKFVAQFKSEDLAVRWAGTDVEYYSFYKHLSAAEKAVHRREYLAHIPNRGGHKDLHHTVTHFICQVCSMALLPMDHQAIFGGTVQAAMDSPVTMKFSACFCLVFTDRATFRVQEYYRVAKDLVPEVEGLRPKPSYATVFFTEHGGHFWSMTPVVGDNDVLTRYMIQPEEAAQYQAALDAVKQVEMYQPTPEDARLDARQEDRLRRRHPDLFPAKKGGMVAGIMVPGKLKERVAEVLSNRTRGPLKRFKRK